MGTENVTSVLLPSASIDFFLLDSATEALVLKLKADWRFARVGFDINKAGIETAALRYFEVKSPELIIIETDDIGENFIAKLEGLASMCSAGTDAVVIGPKNDVHLYRKLIEMGVKDYLVRPVSEEDLVKVAAKILVEKKGLVGSRLVTVMGSKGGCGATAVAQMLAWNSAEVLKQKTILMDVAGSISNIGLAFGVEPSTGLTEVVRVASSGTEEDMNRICQNVLENLSLLTYGGEPIFNDIPQPDEIEVLINRLMKRYPVVIVDLSYSSRAVQKRLIELSSEVIVVATPAVSALRNTKTLLGEIKTLRLNLDKVDLVLNMAGMPNVEEVPVDDIKSALGVNVACIIEYLPKLFVESETSGNPVGKSKLSEKLLHDMLAVTEKAVGVKAKVAPEVKSSGGFMAMIKKLTEK